MSDDLVKQSIAELQDIVRCRCHPAYTGRGMHDPDCECDSADAVQVVAARIEELETKLAKAVEALGRIASGEFSGRMLTSMPPQDAAAYFARTTIAELKGEDRG